MQYITNSHDIDRRELNLRDIRKDRDSQQFKISYYNPLLNQYPNLLNMLQLPQSLTICENIPLHKTTLQKLKQYITGN